MANEKDTTVQEETTAEKEMEIITSALGKEITVAGQSVMVKPYTWVQTFKMAKPLGAIVRLLLKNSAAIDAALKDDNLAAAFGAIGLEEHPETIIDPLTELITTATNTDKDWVSSLMLNDVIKLSRTVYEVNRDFFSQNIRPLIQELSGNKEEKKKTGN